MALRGWAGSIATAIGVAAAAGAAQLGVAYGTGVIAWRPEPDELAATGWFVSVLWAAWIGATSVIAGAVLAHRLHGTADLDSDSHGRDGDRITRLLWRTVLAIAAGVGAMVTVALVAVPARDASVVDVAAPQAQAVGYVTLGVLVGVAVSIGALAARAVAANLIVTGAWLWTLAVVVVGEGVLTGGDWSAVAPGFWDPGLGEWWWANLRLPEAGIALVVALVIGALAALPAARRGDHPAGVVISGAAGPLVVAAAYLLTQPDLTAASADELSRHLAAPYLVLAGLAGSLLVSAVRPRSSATDDGSGDQADNEDAEEDEDENLAGAGEAPEPAIPAARTPA